MKPTYFLYVFCLLAINCSKQKESENQSTNEAEESSESTSTVEVEQIVDNWDYTGLYGIYLHESNDKGFSAVLEILPEGNDLTFTLTLKQGGCTGQASGSIGMAIHEENEYAGFYDNEACRMEFSFQLMTQSIHIEEVAWCRLHETGCSFNGVYKKRNVTKN